MVLGKRSIKIHTVPDYQAASIDREYAALIEEYSTTQRPRIVLDCAMIWKTDSPTIQQLLSYLEQAMRLNGDVRLSSLRPELAAELDRVGVSRLFEIYPTIQQAVHSFHSHTSSLAPISAADHDAFSDSEHAA